MLALGDVVGEAATLFLRRSLPRFRKEKGLDLVLANGENSSRRGGIDPESAEMLFSAGVDLVTTGNHVFRQREIYDFLDGAGSLLRPCNYPARCPGRGYTVCRIGGYFRYFFSASSCSRDLAASATMSLSRTASRSLATRSV